MVNFFGDFNLSIPTKIKKHFAEIAPYYEDVRLTDVEPVRFIMSFLCDGPLKGIDVGCGNGRYTRLLAQHSGQRLTLVATDASQEMLDMLATSSPEFQTHCSNAEVLPLASGEYDFITTFNAVHHFDIPRFFAEACRLLEPKGLLFIYTRTPAQNAQTIWGKCFPMFNQVETRLRRVSDFLSMAIDRGFAVADIEIFRYHRVASLQELVCRARSFHYSTFRLIPEEHFEDCIAAFERIVREAYVEPDQVKWIDSNVLLVFRKPK